MKKINLRAVVRQANKLAENYGRLENIIFDDWRGWRFIFDTPEVLKCNNDCGNCKLYKFLKQLRPNFSYARLFKASGRDQKMFGPQKFLNCKTLAQYQKCYSYFLLEETKTKGEIERELDLLRNMRVIYTKNKSIAETENNFKKAVLRVVLSKSDKQKKRLINNYLDRAAVN